MSKFDTPQASFQYYCSIENTRCLEGGGQNTLGIHDVPKVRHFDTISNAAKYLVPVNPQQSCEQSDVLVNVALPISLLGHAAV